jgi:GTPase Era involved in 16S rRNA processing
MSSTVPKFAVIGRVNKGKSSIVSTLAEDDSVNIDAIPGTTRYCQEFPFRLDGRTLIILIDTPGFQQAPRALAWLKDHEDSVTNRREVVAKFVKNFQDTGEFVDECRLLEPILNGAGILYVVDGAKPFRKNYEAEMEILRWTGQPRMALINKIGEGDFSDEWCPALDQYFSVVRSFNAHYVGFQDRIRLLEAFRELHDPWRDSINESVHYLKAEWERRQRISANVIASLLIDELTYEKEIAINKDENPKNYKHKIEAEFHDYLRNRERKARKAIEHLYQHLKIETEEDELDRPVFEQDLFAKSTWSLLGLTTKQLIALGAIAGATVGGILDAAVGGASFMAGTLIGGAIGAGSILYISTNRFATIENIIGVLQGKQMIRIGPHKNPNFPWVLLDRALLHYKSIRDLAHSRREKIKLSAESSDQRIAAKLDSSTKKELNRIFSSIRKKRSGDMAEQQRELETVLMKVIEQIGS